MGGWDPVSYEPVGEVFVYDFTAQKWRQGKDMPSKRSFFGIGAIHGRVYIAGGHDENKCALKSAWSYDVREDEWTELTQMSQERDECEGLLIGDDFWIVSGYGNEKQGLFEASAESYQMSTVSELDPIGASSWSRVFGVGFGGGRALVIGSAFPGTSQGFFMVEGQNGRVKMLDVPHEFSGFVQSGCCIEI
ncbi:unnamed protein product [Thlaspi arvense]|uniref:Uncharacterized protein n=1 Tax=Thlaspi arvense TaxID=13288 RepID=A0AAU9RJ75_THLAR|nr:unnamed protein product [Thlaspi arvense]